MISLINIRRQQILESLNDWTKSIENKELVKVLYVDFEKAFDKLSIPKTPTQNMSYWNRGIDLSNNHLIFVRPQTMCADWFGRIMLPARG